MNVNTSLAPLQQYPPSWGIILGSILAVIIAFYIIMLILTRKTKIQHDVDEMHILSLPERLSKIKNKYAQEAITVQAQFNQKEITTRQSFQALSVILRNFTHEYSQTRDHVSTLEELKAKGAPDLLKKQIESFYPAAFQKAESTQNVKVAVDDVLRVIQQWH